MSRFKHFGHHHDLDLWEFRFTSICMICNSPISGGEIRYACVRCFWMIHKECHEFPQHIASHPLHQHHSLTLTQKTFKNTHISTTNCYYCDQPFSTGDYYTYSCDSQQCPDFQMHATCGAVPLPTPITSHDHAVVRFACHQHPMVVATNLEGKAIEALCFACRLPWSSPDHRQAYSCAASKDCENFFHKSCGRRLFRRISHPFHRHSLSLQVSKPRTCDSCCKKDCRLVYACLESGCGFSLCTQCAHFKTTAVPCQSHDHPLCLVERSFCDDNIHCEACLKSYNHQNKEWVSFPEEVIQTRSLLFRCLQMECSFKFDLHFLCGPLPVRVKYQYHIHYLNLVDSSTVKVNDDSDEYYCDACEEKRDPQFRVYHCFDCKYVAHIHCVLSEIMKVIKASTRSVKLMALGDNRWDDDDFDKKENDLIITMRDIMNSLTETEKRLLLNPRDGGDPVGMRSMAYSSTHTFGEIIDSWFDREKSTEEVSRVQHFFNFKSDDYLTFLMELECFRLEEGLRLEDKYLRQKVEDVNGYKVPKTLSPVLRTLLRKNGDFGGYSDLTPGMKSVCATLLCITIDGMCKTKVEDLTRDDLKRFYFYLRGLFYISDFKIYRCLKAFEEIYEAFLGFEVSRFEKDVGEKLKVKVKTFEEGLKRYKENLDKFKTYASVEKSEFMKKCFDKASKRRGKYVGDELF